MRFWLDFPAADAAGLTLACTLLLALVARSPQALQDGKAGGSAPVAPVAPGAVAGDAASAAYAPNAAAAAAAAAPSARPKDASALLATLATMAGFEAGFEEEKQLALLAAPLKSRGRLYFMRPGYLVRVVEAPEPSTLTISPTELQLAGRDGVERIDLRQSEDVRAFITALVQVFLGDEVALQRSFDLVFVPTPEDASGWMLSLTPRSAPLDKLMRVLRLHGEGFVVRTIEVEEPGGDRTRTHIVNPDVERRFSVVEQERLFGLRAP